LVQHTGFHLPERFDHQRWLLRGDGMSTSAGDSAPGIGDERDEAALRGLPRLRQRVYRMGIA
jgi:hypothetical protein